MGIRPQSGTPVETNYRIDGSTEAQQLINDAQHTGNEAGKVFAEVAAKAESANAGATELSRRIKALEDSAQLSQETISGAGWVAKRWGKTVTLLCLGVKENFTLPPRFRPFDRVYAPISVGKSSMNGRIGVMPSGSVEIIEGSTVGAYAVATYLTT